MASVMDVPNTEDYAVMEANIMVKWGWPLSLVAFYWFFWRMAGQTVGMKAWRLKLVNIHIHQPPGHMQCFIRAFTAPPLICFFGLSYLWCLVDKNGDSLHDKLSKTRVLAMPKEKK